MEERNFQPENFARFHPGGSLGRRLLGKVRDEMVSGELPIVRSDAPFHEVINVISAGQLGLAVVLDMPEPAIITDGDLRRAMESNGKNVFDLKAMNIATFNPLFTHPEVSIQAAFELMDEKKVNALLVFDGNALVGFLKK